MSVHVGLAPHPGVEPAEEVVAGAAEEEEVVVEAAEEAAAVVEEEAEAVTETEAGETEKEGLVATEASKHVEKIVGDVTAKTRDTQRCWHYS